MDVFEGVEEEHSTHYREEAAKHADNVSAWTDEVGEREREIRGNVITYKVLYLHYKNQGSWILTKMILTKNTITIMCT